MPSDTEGESFEPVDEGSLPEGDGGGGDDGGSQDTYYGTSLFEKYLAAVANKATPAANKATPAANERVGVDENRNDIPHAVPMVVDYHPNEHAGQPIRTSDEVDPQAYVTGNLANDALFELADFINSTGMSSSERETFFKLEMNQHLLWKTDAQFMKDIKNLPKGPEMRPFTVTVGEGDSVEAVEMWSKDIVEVLKYLVGDPRFKEHINYVPRKEYTDQE
ncbi:hypothetical protein FRC06_001421 [Ceratobasidium sp. 370]|nr:hypothetical protein FRC06_001421 [Ceratobasidium sp. 370]